jgi:hypothetical protein
MLNFLLRILGFGLFLIGLWCIAFNILIIFNLLPFFDNLTDSIKDFLIYPFNLSLQLSSSTVDWESVRHLSVFERIFNLLGAMTLGFICSLFCSIVGWILWNKN